MKEKKPEIILKENTSNLIKDASDPWVLLESTRAHLKNKNFSLAIKELEKISSCEVRNHDLHMSCGRIYRKLGEYDLSIKEFKKAFEMKSSETDIFFRNKVLNEIEISQRRTMLDSMPRYLGVTLSSKCNLRCIMCEVSLSDWEMPGNTIEEIKMFFPYLEHIDWQGGEVFMLDYFQELFEKASSYPNLKQTIVTNGLLIDEGWAEKLVKSNVDITFSIDGVTKETYERIRRGARFEELLKSIKILNTFREKYSNDGNFDSTMVGMQVVVMRSNYHELKKMVEFARKHKFGRVFLQPVQGNLDNKENIFLKNNEEILRDINKNIQSIRREAIDSGITLIEWLTPFCNLKKEIPHIDVSVEKNTIERGKGFLCYAPWQQMNIEWGGDVYPHCHCIQDGNNEPKKIGNVLQENLTEIWNGKKIQLFRKKIIENDFLDLCNRGCINGTVPSYVRDVI